MKTLTLILVFASILFASCSDSGDSYPKTYTSNAVLEGSLKLYTIEGEIKNPETIESFKKRYKQFVIQVDTIDVKGKTTVTYKNSSDIVIKASGKEKAGKAYTIDNVIYWEHPDTLTAFQWLPFNKYRPIYSEEKVVSQATGYGKKFLFKDCIFVENHQGQLRIPMVAKFSKVTNAPAFGDYSDYYQANNVIVVDSLFPKNTYLDANDTIMIQEYYIEMK